MAWRTRLSDPELAFADYIAQLRNARSSSAGDEPAFGAPPNDGSHEALVANVVGARGELAVARFLNLYPNFSVYHEEKTTGGHDLSHEVSVRSARKRHGLLVRPNDVDGRYVAAVVGAEDVLLLGWYQCAEAKQERWSWASNGRPPCFLVPEKNLRSMEELRALVDSDRILGCLRIHEIYTAHP